MRDQSVSLKKGVRLTVKMANEESDECYSPLLKKSRLSRINDNDLNPYLDLNSKYIVGSLNNPLVTAFEVSRSAESEMDLNGGDSGFQDFNEAEKLSLVEDGYETLHEETKETTDFAFDDEGREEAESGPKEVDAADSLSDDGSDISNISCGSYLSNMSGEKWKPISGPLTWVQQQITFGTNPRDILQEIVPNAAIPPHVENLTLWRLILSILSEPPRRKKLPHVNTLNDVVDLIKTCKKIIVLTGAGVSVSCGIPDFRSRDGIYARLSKDFPDLPDPQAMFDIHYFRRDQRPFFKFAREIYPGLFKPSLSHKFIKLMEKNEKLLRNYSQNIDTLEKLAGIENVITCHGSFATASCTRCKHKVDSSLIKDDIFAQKIPRCPVCPLDASEMAVMKPDIVFFGEGLSDEFHEAMTVDKDNCDLLIVIGSSLKVRPVALIPSSIPSSVPQILINREKLPHLTFDVELLGDCDVIVREICNRLGGNWTDILETQETLREVTEVPGFQGDVEINNNEGESAGRNDVTQDANPVWTSSSVGIPTEGGTSAETDARTDEFDEVSSFRSYKTVTIADRLPDKSYLFWPPSCYVFKGAEVVEDELKSTEKFEHDDDSSRTSSLNSELSLSSKTEAERADQCSSQSLTFSSSSE